MEGKRQGNWNPANKLSDAKLQTIKERMNEPGLSRRKLAEELNICISSLYRYIRMFGGNIDHSKSSKQEGVEDMIRRYYPHYTASEIATMRPEGFKISKSRVLEWAERLGVKHTPETLLRIRAKQQKNIRSAHTEEGIRKRIEKIRRTRLMENFRHNSGIPQKTKLKMKRIPQRYVRAAWHLEKKHGYIRTTDYYTLWWDENTRRTPNERMYEQKYGFKFEKAKDNI